MERKGGVREMDWGLIRREKNRIMSMSHLLERAIEFKNPGDIKWDCELINSATAAILKELAKEG